MPSSAEEIKERLKANDIKRREINKKFRLELTECARERAFVLDDCPHSELFDHKMTTKSGVVICDWKHCLICGKGFPNTKPI